jgi:hypothetical protein
MDEMPPALPHGQLKEVFPDVFFVTGLMETVLMDVPWKFSRNMTVVREGDALTLINAIRLEESALTELEAIGRVANVVKIASWHGRDDCFYKTRYDARLWALPNMQHAHGLIADKELTAGEIPFADCRLFEFRTTKLPEGLLLVDRSGGILVSGDSLQNYVARDQFFSDDSFETMTKMGFFEVANFGPYWLQVNETQAQDFVRVLELQFQHVLPGHGKPLRNRAKEAFTERFRRVFGVAPATI